MARAKIELDVEAVEREAARGLAEYQVAAVLGVSADTMTRCKREQPGVAEALERGRATAIGVIENVMFESAKQAATTPSYQTSAIFWLKARAGWKDRTVIEHEVSDERARTRDEIAERIQRLVDAHGGVAG